MPANSNFDAIASSTSRYWGNGKFADAVFNGTPFFAWLNAAGRKRMWDGGDFIIEPVMGETNSTIQTQNPYDEVDFTPQDGLSAAQFSPKMYTGSVVMSHADMWRNSGKSKQIDLWETKVMQAKMAAQTRFNTDLFTDVATTGPGAIVGLVNMVASSGTYGNIARASNTFWQSYVESTAGPLTTEDMRIAYNTISRARGKCDFIVTTQTLFQKYESLVEPALRIPSTKVGELGFDSLTYKGIPIVWDPLCTSGVMYFLTSEYIALRPHQEADFKMSDRLQPTKQFVDALKMVWYGALTCCNPRYQGKLTGRTV